MHYLLIPVINADLFVKISFSKVDFSMVDFFSVSSEFSEAAGVGWRVAFKFSSSSQLL